MSLNSEHIDDLIISVLSGNAGAQECAALKKWISGSADNRRHFQQLTDAWFASAAAGELNRYDAAAAFKRFAGRTQPARNHPIHRQQPKRTVRLRIPHIAVMLVAVFALGAMCYRYMSAQQPPVVSYYETIVPLGAKSQIVLTDGTKVWLNAGSRLRYSTSFAIHNRNVELEGEGYFEVAKNQALPFEVKTHRLNVKATGTAFNVKAYANDSIVETILVEGKVEVSRSGDMAGQKAIHLQPKQRLTLVKHTGEMLFEAKPKTEKAEAPQPAKTLDAVVATSEEVKIKEVPATSDYMVDTSWKDKRWRIDGEELRSLAIKLERRYNVHISFADSKLKYYRFNGTLEDEPIEAVLKVMAQIAPVKFELRGAEVVLLTNDKFHEQHKDLYNK